MKRTLLLCWLSLCAPLTFADDRTVWSLNPSGFPVVLDMLAKSTMIFIDMCHTSPAMQIIPTKWIGNSKVTGLKVDLDVQVDHRDIYKMPGTIKPVSAQPELHLQVHEFELPDALFNDLIDGDMLKLKWHWGSQEPTYEVFYLQNFTHVIKEALTYCKSDYTS